MKKNIMDCFGITGVILDKVDTTESIELITRMPRNYCTCPKCGKATKKVHDKRIRRLKHGICQGKKTFVLLTLRRFACSLCGPFKEEQPPWVQGRQRHTEHFEKSVVKALEKRSFLDVGKEYGVSMDTLVSILKKREREIEIPQGKLILNIDEHSWSGRQMKITVGEVVNRKVLAVLYGDSKPTLEYYLKNLKQDVKSRILEVCIDMKVAYLYSIKECLPNVSIVIDRFHVVREMNRQVEEMRKVVQEMGKKGMKRIPRFLLLKKGSRLTTTERKRLAQVFDVYKNFPTLKHAYFVKEKIQEMYELRDKKEATRIFDQLILQLEQHEVGKLKEMRDTLKRWRPYILNFFDRRTTNAFIEGCHNKIKLIKRMSYGFRNFKNYVLKITLAFLPFLFLKIPH